MAEFFYDELNTQPSGIVFPRAKTRFRVLNWSKQVPVNLKNTIVVGVHSNSSLLQEAQAPRLSTYGIPMESFSHYRQPNVIADPLGYIGKGWFRVIGCDPTEVGLFFYFTEGLKTQEISPYQKWTCKDGSVINSQIAAVLKLAL